LCYPDVIRQIEGGAGLHMLFDSDCSFAST